jgi:hypothetical protein
LCNKNFQNSLRHSDKVVLDCRYKLTDVYDSSNLNLIKEHDVTVVSYAHSQRDSSNELQLVEVFETLDGEDSMGTTMTAVIEKANISI